MTKEYKETLTEVSEILKHMSKEDVDKIPIKLLEFINQNKSEDYSFFYIEDKPFENQNIKRETLAFLGLLSINYWCADEREKNELYQKFKANDEKFENEIREKYSLENLLKISEEEINFEGIVDSKIIEYEKQNFFRKILIKIKNMFMKK